MVRSKPTLVKDVRRALRVQQAAFAGMVYVGSRTIQRWESGESEPGDRTLTLMAEAVQNVDPTLAAELRAYTSAPRSVPAVAGAVGPLPARHILVDSVVCAAAEAAGLVPSVVRPALFYAFARARDARLSIDDVLAELTSKG